LLLSNNNLTLLYQWQHLERELATSVQPLKKPTVSAVLAHRQLMEKKAANIIKPKQTRIYRKKYVNCSVILKRHRKKGATLILA
jgi:hypothetical protein